VPPAKIARFQRDCKGRKRQFNRSALSDELYKLATYSLKPSINLLGSNAGGGEGLVGKGGVDAHVKTEHEEGREGVGDCVFQGQ